MKYYTRQKKQKRLGKETGKTALVFFCTLFILSFSMASFSYANQEKAKAKNANGVEFDDDLPILQFESQAVLLEKIEDFIPLKDKYDELYLSVQKQMPSNGYLLEAYVPQSYKQTLEREHYENVTRVVYLYSMPLMVGKREHVKERQTKFVNQALESVFATYNKLNPPKEDTKGKWEQSVYEFFRRGESIYFKYPKKDVKNYKYTILQSFSLSENQNAGAFLSTYVFLRGNQMYFLSASSFLTDNNYYEELMWTRNTLDTFIKVLVEEKKEITE